MPYLLNLLSRCTVAVIQRITPFSLAFAGLFFGRYFLASSSAISFLTCEAVSGGSS